MPTGSASSSGFSSTDLLARWEIQKALSAERAVEVNSGVLTPILRPLLDAGILERQRPRGPISVRDAPRVTAILRAAALMPTTVPKQVQAAPRPIFADLRDALIRQAPPTGSEQGGEGT